MWRLSKHKTIDVEKFQKMTALGEGFKYGEPNYTTRG
jgi:hypothetical protein